MARKQSIIDEVRQKIEDYEDNNSSQIAEYNEWSDIFTVKKPLRDQSSRTYSNPRLTEMFRAVNALATLEVRMMTAQDPYFELAPMDLGMDNRALSRIEAMIQTQLRVTQHKRYLLKACISQILFGTVIVEEDVRMYGLNPFGRKIMATSFVPRSLLQVSFDRGTFDIDDAMWLSTSDVKHKEWLRGEMRDDPEGDVWFKSEMEAAMADDGAMPNQNQFVVDRMTRAGYSTEMSQKNVRMVDLYRGKLDVANDGVEYVVGLINRKHLVRFHPNQFQHGKRNFRVARWVEYELEPLAYGVGKLLASLHKSMDANRQKVQDSITFDTYNMWLLDRMANIDAQDFKVQPVNIIETDDINGLKRVESNVAGATLGMKLDEALRNEFQAASGATPTLQALVTDATASEVSLAQNEALRNISVKAEVAAEPLVREHIEIMHSNNAQFMTEAAIVSKGTGSQPMKVYPADMWYDTDFKTKIVTDKDYKPQRLKSMIEVFQILTSIRNDNPEKYEVSIIPFVKEIARSLGINAEELIKERDPAEQMLKQLLGMAPAGPGQGIPPGSAGGGSQATPATMSTPVGEVMVSP